MTRFTGIRRYAAVALAGALTVVGSLALTRSAANADNSGCGQAGADYAGRKYHGFVTEAASAGRADPMYAFFGTDGSVTTLIIRPAGVVAVRSGYTVDAGAVSWSAPASTGPSGMTFSSRDRGCDNSVAVPRSIGGVTSEVFLDSAGRPTGTQGAFTLYRER